MTPFWLVRMYRWVRNPPTARQVRLVLAVVAVCLLLVAIELVWGWPEWATVNSGAGRRMW